MKKIEKEILDEIKNYDWKFLTEDGFCEDRILYEFRNMYEAVKRIKLWQNKLLK